METSLRKELGVRKSLQVLQELSSPMVKTGSPLILEAGTPAPFLNKTTSYTDSLNATPVGRLSSNFNSPSNSVFAATPSERNNSYLLNSSHLNVTPSEDISTHTILLEKDPAMEGAGNLFEEFMDLLNTHPHSSDVFNLVEQYETLCRDKIKSLLQYINKTDPSRRRLKKTVNLLNQLYRECYTWRLLSSLFRDRLASAASEGDADMQMLPAVDSSRSELLIVQRLFEMEASTRQCQIIVDWLERNMQDKLEDLIESENLRLKSESMYWEHTVHDLNQVRMQSKDPTLASNLVTEVDPDAPLRQQRALSSLDQQDEEQLLVYMFRFIRAGKLDEAQNLCNEQGHFWRAATLDGWRLWHDPNYFTDVEGEIIPAKGNPDRDLWKINCWALSEEKGCSVHEKAIYASLSGHLKQLLPACSCWEDQLWAHFKVYIDVRVEQEIRNQPRSNGNFLDLPHGYWEQVQDNELNPENILSNLSTHPNPDIQRQSEDIYRSFQSNIILNQVDEMLARMKKTIAAKNDDPHLFRCMAHLVLFLQSVGIQTQEEVCVEVLHKYVEILIERKQTKLVAKYTSCLPHTMQTDVYATFLQDIYDEHERRAYLELGEQAGLDLKQITKRVVENILSVDGGVDTADGSEADNVKINAITWLLFDDSQRAEAVKQANTLTRLFLASKKFAASKAVFDVLPDDSIDVIHTQWRRRAGEKALPIADDNAIREHFCLKTYMIAHDAFNAWFKHYYDQAPLEPKAPGGGGTGETTFKEQILYEEGLKEYEAEFERWKKTLQCHVTTTSNCIFNVLLFPGGWLVDPRSPSPANITDGEEGEGASSAGDANRQHQLLVLRQICIPYLTFLLQKVFDSSKQLRSVLQLAEVIQSKEYKLYEVFHKHKIQKYLGLVRQTCINLLDEGYDAFGFERSNIPR